MGCYLRKQSEKTVNGGAYEEYANKAADGMIKNYSGSRLTKPEKIAKTIRKAVMKRKPKTRYLIGFMAKPMVITKRLFGDRFYDFIIKVFG